MGRKKDEWEELQEELRQEHVNERRMKDPVGCWEYMEPFEERSEWMWKKT